MSAETMNDLAKRIAALSPEQRKLFEQRLKQQREQSAQVFMIPRRQSGNSLPLSFDQERIWFFEQLEPNSCLYNIPFAVRLEGTLDAIALQQSFSAIMQRHESLRTTFTTQDGQPIQVIHPTLACQLVLREISDRQILESQESELASLLFQESQRPFDLAHGPLLRAVLLRLNPTHHVLLVVLHHLIADGWSRGVFIEELAACYQAFNRQVPVSLPELPIQYGDVAVWQRQWLESEAAKSQLTYWQQQLQDLPILNLPTDKSRPSSQTFNGAKLPVQLSDFLTRSLKALSQQEGTTLFMTLLTAFNLLLHYYSGQEDVVVGTDVANRNRTETERLIGLFVNQLVLRTDLSGNPTFRQLLARVRQVTVDAYAHQDLPFNTLVEALNPNRASGRSPLFQVKFVLQNAPMPPLALPGLTVTPLEEIDTQTATLDLFFALSETEQGLVGAIEYNTDLFVAATVQRLLGHFQHLLEQVVAHPDRHLCEFSLLTAAEWEQITSWNQTDPQVDALESESTLVELFEAQVARTPNAIAVTYEDQSLTYSELNQRANQLAHYLRSLGVRPEVLVGLCVERSLEMIVGILAILKAGAAYVPLDPSYPLERLAFMLHDAQVPVLVTMSSYEQQLSIQKTVICLDRDATVISQQSLDNLVSGVTADHLAYVIYTSGSTGKPKGVLVNHRNVVRLFTATQPWYHFNDQDVWTLFHSYAFDFSVWEIWGALLYGGRLVVVSYWNTRSPEAFYKLLCQERVTVLNQTPSAFRQLIQAETALGMSPDLSLRLVIFGGEALSYSSLQPWLERHGDQSPQLVNMYGITETTVHVTYHPLSMVVSDATKSVVGKPIPDLQVYILNQYQQPVPIGVPGEMYVGGAGVARGYLNRPELTQERFITNPFSEHSSPLSPLSSLLYRSGDLARYLPDGTIEYLGRIDHQVKLRGFRIELGEIEAALGQHSGVQEQAVIVREGQDESEQLVAYIVPQAEATPDLISQLRDWLKARLPEYMVPTAFVALDSIPLTPNGKLDRKNLPAPTGDAVVRSQLIAPRTATEKQLAEIWSQLLGIEAIGIQDNFFELGGHSLLATQVISRIRETLGIDISLRQIFAYPTIVEFAVQVEQASNTTTAVPPLQRLAQRQQLPLSFAQQRLWFLHQLNPDDLSYNCAGAIQLQGQLNIAALEQSLNALIQRHEVLRTQFVVEEGQPIQVILPTLQISLPVVDLRQDNADLSSWLQKATQQRFDLTQAPLFRFTLLRLTDTNHTLLMSLHHIISDAWSIGVFLQELAELYTVFITPPCGNAFSERSSPHPAGTLSANAPHPTLRERFQRTLLTPLPIQYADFAVWQRQWLQGEVLESQLAYWKTQFREIPPPLKFAIANTSPEAPATSQGARHPLTLTTHLTTALKTLSQETDATLFMTLLAGFNALLHYATQQMDIAVGSPIANRNRREIEGLIGFFVNTLVLRTDLSGDPTFRELVLRVRETALGAYANQDVPFERLVTELQIDRQLGQSPLFQTWFVLQNTPMPSIELPGLQLALSDLDVGVVRHDLKLDLTETTAGLEGFFEYKTAQFEAIAITRLASLYQTLLETVIAQPDIRLSRLTQILAETEKQQQQQAGQAFKATQRQKLSQIKRKRS
ncbi:MULTISPECIES: non-ribosomal peptide synthetase [Trichocoleus]|uniref:Non-ribosomal peptide synthetase n=1 Tax=Trichocoleus desertorum GB2-A4 TaxID=2933944 RepID=A0ABV0JC29_9CYAN|nr:non-ribosomal peptide synthetase [Trichocoleus sp. FACHB-46]MBD1865329.1 amino acid adenylation domain-containing protein [Trichocoleus sp. FACHB-46]